MFANGRWHVTKIKQEEIKLRSRESFRTSGFNKFADLTNRDRLRREDRVVSKSAAIVADDDRDERSVQNPFPVERFREMIYYAVERAQRGTERSVTCGERIVDTVNRHREEYQTTTVPPLLAPLEESPHCFLYWNTLVE